MGKRARQRRQPPAATGASPSVGDAVPWPSAIVPGTWVDAAGTSWHLRGGEPPVKRVEHLLRSPEVPVLHFYGPDPPREVAEADRETLWQRMRPYLRETVREPGDHTTFDVAEFKDDRRRYMLVIEEGC
ncbi:hypothetical protein SAMN05428965_4025 [Geodermatophilus sp. DSM 45219]|nr:hypothetical protein SAMN05428965_4025 [Geodermatophilus sp. DSM 45219]